uniref:Reverse transcriptase domain-containing protein n=1 Tax=Toxocara canis TaxID=6265 RepID=A0A183U2X6_TOXCA
LRNLNNQPTKDNLRIFCFARISLGVIPLPSLLATTIRHRVQLRNESIVADELLYKMYLDNIMLTAETVDKAAQKSDASKKLFQLAEMTLRERWEVEPRQKDTNAKILDIPSNVETDKISFIFERFEFMSKRDKTKEHDKTNVAIVGSQHIRPTWISYASNATDQNLHPNSLAYGVRIGRWAQKSGASTGKHTYSTMA